MKSNKHLTAEELLTSAAALLSGEGSKPSVTQRAGRRNDDQPPAGTNAHGAGIRTLAKRATGPATEHGKKIASRNAIKHGIFAAAVLKKEKRAEYLRLVDDLQEFFRPEGSLETLLVGKLAMLLWRHRRLLTAECAEITRWSEGEEEERLKREALEIEDRIEAGKTQHGMARYSDNPFVLDRCIELLKEWREEVKKGGCDAFFNNFRIVLKLYGRDRAKEWVEAYRRIEEENHPISLVEALRTAEKELKAYDAETQGKAGKEEKAAKQEKASEEQDKEFWLQHVDSMIERVTHHRKLIVEFGSSRRLNNKNAYLVPPTEVVERLVRYEAHLNREFDRTLSQLERLQRMRLGQPVPPPIKVNLSS